MDSWDVMGTMPESNSCDHDQAGSITEREEKQQPFPVVAYFCFAAMNLTQRSMSAFYQGIADKALGHHGSNVGIIMLCQFISQCLTGALVPHWSALISHNTRISMVSMLFVANIVGLAIFYGQSADIEAEGLLFVPRMVILCCVVVNSVSVMVTEITLLQYLAFYPSDCAKGLSLGNGFGALVGATWALTIRKFDAPWKSIAVCLMMPTILFTTFFRILPPRSFTKQMLATKLNQSNPKSKTNSVQKSIAHSVSRLGVIGTAKTITVQFARHSLPLLTLDFMFEIIRSGFLVAIWTPSPKHNFFGTFLCVFHLANASGSVFVTFFPTRYYRRFLFIELLVGAALGAVYYLPPHCALTVFLRDTATGHYMVLSGFGVPLGLTYGLVIASTYYAIRRDIRDETLGAFVLGNMRQMFTYGQIGGALIALALHWNR